MIMRISKIIKSIMFLSLMVTVSCTTMNDPHDKYLENGEIMYIGRIDSSKFFSGNERFLLRYWITDPRAKELKIYWSQRQDSIIVPVPIHAASDFIDVLVSNVPEGNHTLQIFSNDGTGIRSIVYEVIGNVYGGVFASTLLNRNYSSATYTASDKKVDINWTSPLSTKESGLLVKYYTLDGKSVLLRMSTDEVGSITSINNVDVTKNITCQTMYLPEPTSIDTFFTAPEKITIKERINIALGSTATTSDILDGYPGSMAVDGDNTSTPSRWVTDETNNEHWLALDLGAEYSISAFETWSGAPAQAQFKFQAEIDGEWKDLYSTSGNSNLQFFGEFATTKARKVRYYIPAYSTNRVRLFELAVYSVKEY